MYEVLHASAALEGVEPLVATNDEADALLYAVKRVTEHGADLAIVFNGYPRWDIEADTKTLDDAPYFPAIVHRRMADA